MSAIIIGVGKQLVPALLLLSAEERVVAPFLAEKLGGLQSPNLPGGLSKLYSLVVLSNLVGSGFALVALSMRVSGAREKYGVKLPLMYSSDTDPKSDGYKFNCVQRGHQQALETYPLYLGLSLVSGLMFPITTSLEGVLWIMSRFAWADGYATGEPAARYTFSSLGRHVWTPLVHLSIAGIVIAARQFV